MQRTAPPWLDRVGDVSDTERYARMTPDDRLACFVEVMQLAHAILEGRPDARDVLARVEPLSPQAEALWLRLVRESRARTVG